MSALILPKTLTFDLVINESRNIVETIEAIAQALQVAIGEQEQPCEYIQLKHVTRITTITKEKEAMNARQTTNA